MLDLTSYWVQHKSSHISCTPDIYVTRSKVSKVFGLRKPCASSNTQKVQVKSEIPLYHE